MGGVDSDEVDMTLYVSAGSLAFGNSTGLTFTGSNTGNDLKFSGTIAAINDALETLTYTAPYVGGTYEIEVMIDEADGSVYRHANGHVYKVVQVEGGITWEHARIAAEELTFPGTDTPLNGYLATITDEDEHNFVRARIDQDGWIGASDDLVITAGYAGTGEGEWFWVTGPEAGTKFWTGGSSGNVVSGQYANWNREGTATEPNNSGGIEHCAEIRFSANSQGQWNDIPCDSPRPNYVVEFGVPGNLPVVKRATFDVEVAPLTAGVMADFSYTASSYLQYETGVTYTFEYVVSTPNPDNLLEVAFPAEFIVDGMLPEVTINGASATVTHMGGGGDNNEQRTVGVSENVNSGDRITVIFEDITNPEAGTYPFVQLRTSNDDGEGTVTAVDVPLYVAPIVIVLPEAPFDGEGTDVDPYQITGCFTAEWSGYYKLMNDIIDAADSNGDCIVIKANDVVIDGDGKTISETGENIGAAVSSGGPFVTVAYSGLEIKNLTVNGYRIGVFNRPSGEDWEITGNSNVVVLDSTFSHVGFGVLVYGTEGMTIDRVNFSDIEYNAIYIQGNTDTDDIASDISITNSTFTRIDGDDDGVVGGFAVEYITIEGNVFTDTLSDGIVLGDAQYIMINENELINIDGDGMKFYGVSDITISNNTITGVIGGSDGIDFSTSDDNNNSNVTIIGNTITDIADRGIELERIEGNSLIENNTIESSDDGIELKNSYGFIIRNNVIKEVQQNPSSPQNFTALVLDGVEDVLVVENIFQGTKWVEVDGQATFNEGTIGNTYRFANGDGAWTVFDIKDTNNNGYADTGAHVPFRDGLTYNTLSLWIGDGQDNHPRTELKQQSSGGGGSSAFFFATQTGTTAVEETPATPEDDTVIVETEQSCTVPRVYETPFTKNMQRGMLDDDVLALQRFLNNQGFILGTTGAGSPGNETRNFVTRTEDALRRFQSTHNLPITGVFTTETRHLVNRLLAGDTAPTATVVPCPAPTPNPTAVVLQVCPLPFTKDMQRGIVDNDVLALQRFLNNNGFVLGATGAGAPGSETRNFVSRTEDALRRFQSTHNLLVTGTLTSQTRQEINKQLGCAQSTVSTQTVRDLRVGMQGDDVRSLQTTLIRLGYAIPAGPTGLFVTQTLAALNAYQRALGINPPTGVFDAQTRDSMKATNVTGLWW